jgi:hypothetical protein
MNHRLVYKDYPYPFIKHAFLVLFLLFWNVTFFETIDSMGCVFFNDRFCKPLFAKLSEKSILLVLFGRL